MSPFFPHKMSDKYIEEEVNPGYEVAWEKNFNPNNWALSLDMNKRITPKELNFRPRFAMALAMMRRQTGTFLNLNLPTLYHEEHGWMSFNVVLGKEEEWTDPPGKEESITAYMIMLHLEILAGLRVDASIGSFARLALYGGKHVNDINIARNQWSLKSWSPREIINPYDIHSAALMAVAGLLPFRALRNFLGFGYLTAGGPLVWNPPNIDPQDLVLKHWN